MEIIDGNDYEIDVEKIMSTVRDRLERQRAQGPPETSGLEVSRLDSPATELGPALTEPLAQYLSVLNRLHDPKPQDVIAAHGSALKERAKRWLRQVLAPYHRAIFVRQETFNRNLVELLNRLLPAIEAQDVRHYQAVGTLQQQFEAAVGTLQQQFEAHDTRHNYSAGLLKLQLDDLTKQNAELDRQLVDLLFLRDRLAEAWGRIESLRVEYDQAIAQIYTQLEDQIRVSIEQDKRISGQVEALQHQLAGLAEIRNAHVELYRQVDEIKRDNLLQTRRLDLILTELRRKAGLDKRSVRKIAEVQEHLMDHSYYLFEARHRGGREEIKKRQELYVPLFKKQVSTIEKGADGSSRPVLDVGCGRGEMLELLREHGIQAKGIDLNEEMVQFCRDHELDVEQVGVIPYLRAREDDSFSGIIACQVIEHLHTDELIEFLKLCHQKVAKGGLVILETVNPTSIAVSATSFYVDLSHVRQIHPLTLQFLVEALGFLNPEVRFLSQYPDEIKLQLLRESGPDVQILNRNIEKLNELLFGYQDYVLICEK